jgi:DNA-binding NtrC family response regulator
MAHDFPGNVRELVHTIEHAFVLISDGDITPDVLPVHLQNRSANQAISTNSGMALRAVEAQMILAAIKKHGGSRVETARELDMHKTTLFRKIRALGLEAAVAEAVKSQDGKDSTRRCQNGRHKT